MKKSIKNIARRTLQEDQRTRKAVVKDAEKKQRLGTADSFVNFQQKLGVGADNALTTSGYGFNPISRLRTMLEWIHRGSWLGGVAVDLVADDMTRAGARILSTLKPEQIQHIDETMVRLGVWNGVTETVKWARLYGGAVGVMLIDGQNYSTPLRVETVGRKEFRGIYALDRWMVEPSLQDLVTEPGPYLGLPKYYTVTTDAPALSGMKIHYSRVIRLEGIRLPYWQRVQENLWGISVIERLYDRMVAFDSATTGAAQLIYKAYIRTYKIEGLREVIAGGGEMMDGMIKFVEMMRRFQGMEGITLLDAKDQMESMQHSAFGGLSEAILQFGQQLSGSLQIPLVRLFGQSPQGMNATGESDLRMYYDGINQQQNQHLLVPMTRVYRMVAQSEGIRIPEGFRIKFNPLWQLTDKEKSEIADTNTRTITTAEDSGLISQQTAMRELKRQGEVTGIFETISEEDINAAEVTLPPAGEEAVAMAGEGGAEPIAERGDPEGLKGGEAGDQPGKLKVQNPSLKKPAVDSISSVAAMKQFHDLDVVIENPRGSIRKGPDWEVAMPADYGYIRLTTGADGDQVDCYVGPNPKSPEVWVIYQLDLKTKQFDEHKCLLGYDSLKEAMGDYVSGYSDGLGFERIMDLKYMPMDEFKSVWLKNFKK